jgi:hypothetical protein
LSRRRAVPVKAMRVVSVFASARGVTDLTPLTRSSQPATRLRRAAERTGTDARADTALERSPRRSVVTRAASRPSPCGASPVALEACTRDPFGNALGPSRPRPLRDGHVRDRALCASPALVRLARTGAGEPGAAHASKTRRAAPGRRLTAAWPFRGSSSAGPPRGGPDNRDVRFKYVAGKRGGTVNRGGKRART